MPEAARPLAEEAVLLYERHATLPAMERQHAVTVLASVLWNLGDRAALESLHRRSVEALRARLPADDPQLAAALTAWAHALVAQQKLTDAEPLARESLAILEKSVPNDRRTSDSRRLLSSLLQRQGKLAEAETLLREDLAQARAHATNETLQSHAGLGVALHHLADVLRERQMPEAARPLAEEATLLYERYPGLPAGERQHALTVLNSVLTDLGDMGALESLHRRSVEELRGRVPADDPRLGAALASLTQSLISQQKFAEAEAFARESLAIREQSTPDDWRTFNSRSLLGGSLLGLGRFDEAEPLLLSAYEGMKRQEDKIPAAGKPRISETLERLVQLHETTGRWEKAAEWRRKLAESQPTLSPNEP
jgi:tetratricopeptide (TPR) repeat protein